MHLKSSYPIQAADISVFRLQHLFRESRLLIQQQPRGFCSITKPTTETAKQTENKQSLRKMQFLKDLCDRSKN